ncbi:hypothetical protein Y032_0147g2614 [Ancylostoma ceylanicum]|uniref:Uncharacterized protein n=1 Tax=Ancylostoma ceylanicum TaxID=53326 RepID=A0A016T2J2_9BILA|nr:hypothetical protein Y032_0147g2614 [Ancylostoma ceylanicum]
MAEGSVLSAFDYMLILRARLRPFKYFTTVAPRLASPTTGPTPQSKKLELPALPVPSFSGNIWEWDNFWELFNGNVHSQDLSSLYKFNYLLNALKGLQILKEIWEKPQEEWTIESSVPFVTRWDVTSPTPVHK